MISAEEAANGAAAMLDVAKPAAASPAIPFDTGRLDRLIDAAGIDVLLATSKHNVQYLSGGTARSFSTTWMPPGSRATCRCWSIPKAPPTRPPISAIA